MDQKQYDDMATIMQFGILFATAMRRAMKNCGLLDKGFFLSVSSEDIVSFDGTHITGSVRLNRYFDHENPKMLKEDHSDDMSQIEFDGERWSVIDDPYAKAGTVPPEVRASDGLKDVYKGAGKASAKAYPPDGLWLSSRDDYSFLDGGI